MAYELVIIGGGIVFGLIGFFIGLFFIRRAYRASPSLTHYRKIIDILTLRKLRKKSDDMSIPVSTPDSSHIQHYEKMRDKLTTRKKEVEVESSGLFERFTISNLIGGFIVILIGVMLIPPIFEQVNEAQAEMNMNNTTSASSLTNTVLDAVPIFFVLALAGMAIAIVANSLRDSGLT